MKPIIVGSSLSSAMPAVILIAVFMQLSVVPMIAMATVMAMVIIRPKPIPPSKTVAYQLGQIADGSRWKHRLRPSRTALPPIKP